MVINEILWKLRTGTLWRDLSERYGAWTTWRIGATACVATRLLTGTVARAYTYAPNSANLWGVQM
jgi:hypothetical protein